jgi:hypothetical protein
VEDLFGECPITRRAVRACAREVKSCEDLPTLNAVAAVSCALAAKVRGVTPNDTGTLWRFWPHLYIAAEVPSGADKSRTADRMLRHHLSHTEPACDLAPGIWTKIEQEQIAKAGLDEEERDDATKELRAIEGVPPDRRSEEQRERRTELRARLRISKIERPVILETQTPSLQQFMDRCHAAGFRGVVPDEGIDFLRAFMGNGRDKREQIQPLIDAFDGKSWGEDTIAAANRRGGADPRFARLHLAMLLLCQNGTLSPKTPAEEATLQSLATRGLFPRMLFSRPRGLSRSEICALYDSARELRHESDAACAPYGRLIRMLADLRIGDHPLQPSVPLDIQASDDAAEARIAFQRKLKLLVAADGEEVDSPAGRSIPRLQDHASRIALALAVLRTAEEAARGEETLTEGHLRAARIELPDMERAVRVCDGYFRSHVDAVMRRAKLDPVSGYAEEALRIMRTIPELAAGESRTRRELTRGRFREGWGKMTNNQNRLDLAVEELERIGAIEVEHVAKTSYLVRLPKEAA